MAMKMVSSAPKHLEVLTQSSANYEERRTRFWNARLPSARPAEIRLPSTTVEVVDAIHRANVKGLKVGVRSGGHLFPACSLVEGGMLIDTRNLNRNTEYDINTKVVSFSPATTSQELEQYLSSIGRFLPFGHSPTVGLGGFLLAGGQGWFLRGWGLTSSTWITQIEIVTPSGQTILASKTQNADIFWAVPGSGQGFFGVITRFWARTIPAKKVFGSNLVFDATDSFKPLLKWVLETSDKVPRYGVDMTFSVMYADRNAKEQDDPSNNKKVLVLSCVAYADSIDEAKVLLSPWDSVPQEFQNQLLVGNNVEATRWENLWKQDDFLPAGNGERWKCDSILTHPKVTYDDLIEAITPAVYDLPSRLSIGTIVAADSYPEESEHALSLPQKYYISNMACWKNPARDAFMDKWMFDAFTQAEKVAVGQYIADFDVTQRMSKIMTDSALKRWLQIRRKWDPEEMFTGYRGFSSTLEQVAKL